MVMRETFDGGHAHQMLESHDPVEERFDYDYLDVGSRLSVRRDPPNLDVVLFCWQSSSSKAEDASNLEVQDFLLAPWQSLD